MHYFGEIDFLVKPEMADLGQPILYSSTLFCTAAYYTQAKAVFGYQYSYFETFYHIPSFETFVFCKMMKCTYNYIALPWRNVPLIFFLSFFFLLSFSCLLNLHTCTTASNSKLSILYKKQLQLSISTYNLNLTSWYETAKCHGHPVHMIFIYHLFL